MFDLIAIKEKADLLGLAERDTDLKKARGGEYAGPCPKCGGGDRFHVTATWFFCRQCHEKRGDAIEYLQWRDGLTFAEACDRLGGDKSALDVPRSAPKAAQKRELTAWEAPGAAWQTAARGFVAAAEAELWRNAQALDYLRARGLSDATIKAAHLGYWRPKSEADKWRPGDKWGQEKDVWTPEGWVIPCDLGPDLAYIKVRRPDDDLQADPKSAKYIAVKGSKKAGVLYGLADLAGHTDAILCEGEFDALLLRQHLAGLAGVVATGSAGDASPGRAAVLALLPVPRVWGALDTDEAGEKGMAKWGDLLGRVRPLPPPAHDVTDAWKAGHNLALWACSSTGPEAPKARKAWLEGHLARLDDAAFDAGEDETVPELAVWLALYAELARIEGWHDENSESAYKGE